MFVHLWKKNIKLTLFEIANKFNLDFEGKGEIEIFGINTLENAKVGDITFFTNPRYLKELESTNASACIIEEQHKKYVKNKVALLISNNPYYTFARLTNIFYEERKRSANISPSAFISDTANVAEDVYIGRNVYIDDEALIDTGSVILEGCYIGRSVKIGKKTEVRQNSTIEYAIIGDNCLIHSGVRIGQDGFGFAGHSNGVEKIQHVGYVSIGNNVEIGANTCVDRGLISETSIGDNTKIDNLVQIGHNVKIGSYCFIAGQSGIGGSAIIEDNVMIGGKVGIANHIVVGKGAKISGGSGLYKDVPPNKTFGGYPAINMQDWHRQQILMKRLLKNKD